MNPNYPFVCALALYCFMTEYIFVESPVEREGVNRIKEELKGTFACDLHTKIGIALIGCYEPLYQIPGLPIDTDPSDEFFFPIVQRQMMQPQEELRWRSSIPSIGIIQDEVSQQVQAQYEVNPYPRWSSLSRQRPMTWREFISHKIPTLFVEEDKLPDSPRVLIAGCGTGQHAFNTAREIKNSHVIGIDLSRASLAYAMWMREELKVIHIDFFQADILELQEWTERFDLIESVGVLHHLDKPVEGWKNSSNC